MRKGIWYLVFGIGSLHLLAINFTEYISYFSSKSDKVETDKGGEKSLEIKEEPVTGSPERKNESDEETERPPLDLFKSIFENSESEEDEEEEQRQEQVKVEENVVAPPVPVQKVVTTPNLPNKKIATGLFANIDFDKLNQRKSQTVQQPHVALPGRKINVPLLISPS